MEQNDQSSRASHDSASQSSAGPASARDARCSAGAAPGTGFYQMAIVLPATLMMHDSRELLIVSLATERALAHRPNNLNLANTTKLPTFFVSNVGSRGHHPLATLGDPRESQHACGICSARKDSLSRNGLGDPKVLS